MCEIIQKEHNVSYLNDMTHTMVGECIAPLLTEFIHVRKLDLKVSKLGSREKFIDQVYKYRSLPNLLQEQLERMNKKSNNPEEEEKQQEIETNEEVLILGIETEIIYA